MHRPSDQNTHATRQTPQIIPGKPWVATLFSIMFFVAFAGTIFTGPDRFRESFLVDREPSLASFEELIADTSRDPRYVTLRDVRLESAAEKEARENSITGFHQIHPVGNLPVNADEADVDREANDLEEGQGPKLFLICEAAILPGSDEPEDDLVDSQAIIHDLRHIEELTGILRRAHPLVYRIGVLPDDWGIAREDWLLHLDTKPHDAGATLAIVGLFVLLGGLSLVVMMSQNWMPNRGLNLQILFVIVCLLGWPLRRYRDRLACRFAYLAIGFVLIAGGCWLVAARDQGVVIDANYLEHWAAGIILWMLGIAAHMRVLWVTCRSEQKTAPTSATNSDRDDVRTTKDRPVVKGIASLRAISGGVAGTLWLASLGNHMAGLGIELLTSPVVTWTIVGSFLVSAISHGLLQLATRGFCEKAYESLGTTPPALESFRRGSDNELGLAGFQRHGAYRVRGSAFNTTLELHLGCNGVVIAEFILLSGTQAIELTSITESGVCIITSSCKTSDGQPSHRWAKSVHAHSAGIQDFNKLLRTHLQNVVTLAEQNDTSVAILTQDDLVDVLHYSSRAFHDMLVQQGKSRDRVGPMTYGRFRFPTGLVQENTPAADAEYPQTPEPQELVSD